MSNKRTLRTLRVDQRYPLMRHVSSAIETDWGLSLLAEEGTEGAADFLNDGGETGALIRAVDWAATPLGPIAGWPQSLRTIVSLMLANGHAMCMTWGEELTFLYNDAYAPILGTRHPKAMGRPLDVIWHDVWPDIEPLLQRALAGETVRVEDMHLVMTRNGYREDTWWSFSYSPLRDESGRIVGMIDVCVDSTGKVITQRKQDADRARELQLFRQMPGFVAVLQGPDHVFSYVNEAYVTIAGNRDFIGHDLRSVFPELADQGFYELLDQAFASGEAFSARAMPIRLDGNDDDRFIDLLYQPIRDEVGAITGIFVGGYDITERVRGERYRDGLVRLTDQINLADDADAVGYATAEVIGEVLKASRVGYGTIDSVAETLHVDRDWNAPGVETLAGVVPLREYGSFIDSLKAGEFISIDDVDHDDRTAMAADALRHQSAASFVNVPIIEHGQLVAVLYVNHSAVRTWSTDELTFIKEAAARARVAMERLRNDLALRELNTTLEQRIDERSAALRLHENIIQSDATAICAFDTAFRLIAFNKAHNDEFFRANGFYTKIGDVFYDLFVPEQRPVMRAQMARALSGESFTVEEEFGNPAIDAPVWEIHYSPLRDADGRVIGAFHHARDISARLRAQAELGIAQDALRQSQKMEAMGQLTGGVAHDFNNLLTPIVATLDMLQRKQLGGEREQRLINGAVVSADRARTLVQRLLAFARRQPLQSVAVDVATLVEGMAELVASTLGPKIKVKVEVEQGLPHAYADPNQLEMALLNLAVNARDAMPDGGALRIAASTGNDAIRPGELKPGRYVRLSVEDSGFGMEPATLERAIEPFYSTKGVGKGTGLGLSMVHGLASQLGGALHLSSRPGHGTKVDLWLPESADLAPLELKAADLSLPDRRGTVLIVDDEEIVRHSTADMLSELGFDVIEAASAETALALIEGGAVVDLVITDHLMSGMSGSDLARRLRHGQEQLPVLVVSGYAENEGIAPDLPRLTKPFRRDELVASLAGLVA